MRTFDYKKIAEYSWDNEALLQSLLQYSWVKPLKKSSNSLRQHTLLEL